MLNYPDTYELVLQEELPDIHSTGYLSVIKNQEPVWLWF